VRTISHVATLFYYDGIQVFEGRDVIGGYYVALHVGEEPDAERFLVAGVSPEQLRDFRAGMLDLRTLFEQRAEREWYLARAAHPVSEPIILESQQSDTIDATLLPEPGFVLHSTTTNAVALALSEARARNNVVFVASLEPPEAAREHRIHSLTLSGFLSSLQVLVKHAYTRALRQLPDDMPRDSIVADGHVLDVVVPAAAGSFQIVLEAANRPDMFGYNEIHRALEKLDELTADARDPQRSLERVKENRGHVAGAYIRLLKYLSESRSGFRYSWAEPQSTSVQSGGVSESEAGPLVEILTKTEELGVESVTHVGPLRKVDVDAGTWRLGAFRDEGDISGKVRENGPSLGHLETDSNYRFICEEVIEEVSGTGREKKTLYLVRYEPLSP
jgi:hypothetical protein